MISSPNVWGMYYTRMLYTINYGTVSLSHPMERVATILAMLQTDIPNVGDLAVGVSATHNKGRQVFIIFFRSLN